MQCKQEVTYREFKCWKLKFLQEWNEPNRTDFYLMQIAQLLKKSSRGNTLEKCKLPFEFKQESAISYSPEEKKRALAQSKAAWFGAAGYSGEIN